MSAYRAVRSLGEPYFSFTQQDVTGMSVGGLPSLGCVEMLVRAKLYAMPPKVSSPSEIHPLISLHDIETNTTPYDIMAIGVTPDHAVAAVLNADDLSSYTLTTPAGLLGSSTDWLDLYLSYDTGTGDLVFTVNGETYSTTATGLALPVSGRIVKMSLFNGALGTARHNASISRAYVNLFGSSAETATWEMDNRNVPLSPEKVGLAAIDMRLSPAWTTWPLLPKPWGDPPTSDPSFGWRWDTDPGYSRRAIHEPSYTRVEVS